LLLGQDKKISRAIVWQVNSFLIDPGSDVCNITETFVQCHGRAAKEGFPCGFHLQNFFGVL
jgi:hypothetical protein